MSEAASRSRRTSIAVARILDAACDRIARDGIDGIRIAAIADDAGVSPALVHYHFASRDALVAEALDHVFQRAADVRRSWERSRPGTTAAQRLAHMVDQSLPRPGRDADEWRLWLELMLRATRDETLRPFAERFYLQFVEWYAEEIERGVEAGEFDRCDVRRIADLLQSLIDGYGLRTFVGDAGMPLERARGEILEWLARALGAPVGAFS